MHPKALEAQQTAIERAAHRARLKEIVKNAKAGNVKFLRLRRMTLAYVVDKRNVLYVASAVQNPSDNNNPLYGKALAAERLRRGHVIVLHMENCWAPNQFLTQTFRYCK